ncbi:single-stranded DNA-binding protein [Cellvibrio sp. UBA7671]|uniref:single-stranded DNA-binding protein n=1 Tax=Cellvibrio sp. UBA7671 TaxID=1946312 RepID=UPI002F360C72
MKNFFFGEGNIGRDPVLKYISVKGAQKPVLEFDVRFSYDKLNAESGEYEDNGGFWASVSFWGKRAESAHKVLKSGVRVFVIGEQSQDEFIATKGERTGQVLTSTNISASHVGLSLLGIESVNFTPRKTKPLPAGTGTDADGVIDTAGNVDNTQTEAEYYAQQSGR